MATATKPGFLSRDDPRLAAMRYRGFHDDISARSRADARLPEKTDPTLAAYKVNFFSRTSSTHSRMTRIR